MEQSEAHRELREIFHSRVSASFEQARRWLQYARCARGAGHREDLAEFLDGVRVYRSAAARWRRRAASVAPLLVCLIACLGGCAKTPTELTFAVHHAKDGSVVWELEMPTEVWQRHFQPPGRLGRKFQLDDRASRELVSIVDDELTRERLCPYRWSFGRAYKFNKSGVVIFTGRCNESTVRG